jgi:hypothetical protein
VWIVDDAQTDYLKAAWKITDTFAFISYSTRITSSPKVARGYHNRVKTNAHPEPQALEPVDHTRPVHLPALARPLYRGDQRGTCARRSKWPVLSPTMVHSVRETVLESRLRCDIESDGSAPSY